MRLIDFSIGMICQKHICISPNQSNTEKLKPQKASGLYIIWTAHSNTISLRRFCVLGVWSVAWQY